MSYNLLGKKEKKNKHIMCPSILHYQSFLCTVDIVLLDKNCSFRLKKVGFPPVPPPAPATLPPSEKQQHGEGCKQCSAGCQKGWEQGLGME